MLADTRSVSLSVGYMAAKEGPGPDSDGLLEIPQSLEHTKKIPRFPNLRKNPWIKATKSATATTSKKGRFVTHRKPLQNGTSDGDTSSSEGTVDLDAYIVGPTHEQDTVQSTVLGNDRLTQSVSSSFCKRAQTDGRSQVNGSAIRTMTA